MGKSCWKQGFADLKAALKWAQVVTEQTLGWSPEQYPSTGKIDFATSQLLAESGPHTLAKRPWEPAAQPGQAA